MLFNNNNGSFGPLDWLEPTSLATTPFMRGDYVPVLRLVNRQVQQPSELIKFAGIQHNDFGEVSEIFAKLGQGVKDYLKKSAQEKLDECKNDPDSCVSKLQELAQARKELKKCMKSKIGRRKRQRCKEELRQIEENMETLEQFTPQSSPTKVKKNRGEKFAARMQRRKQQNATSTPTSIPVTAPIPMQEEKDNTALYIGGAIITLGVVALVYNMRG